MEAFISADRERRLANELLQCFGHEPMFAFDLLDCSYEPMKTMLEIAGFSVHRDPRRPWKVIAYRMELDTAPLERGKALVF